MANYDLVLNTRFNPFSYAEMLAPVAAATQAHQALEEEYGNLSAKASIWENMANQQKDPIAYKTYKSYANDLETRADQLLKEGLNASSRKGMLDMRARYSKEITPIENAYKRREELAAEQRKAYAANPTLRYERYARDMSLDDLIKNPSLDYGRSYSGALLTQQVSQALANYSKTLVEEGKLESLGLPYQYTKKIRRGASPEEVAAVINDAALAGHEGAVNFIKTVRDQVINASGTNDWITPGSAAAKERDAFANLGVYSAIGQTEIKDYTDKYNMDNALAIAKERRYAEAQAAAQLKMYDINPTKLYGKSEVTKKNAKIAEIMKKDIYPYFWNKGRKALTLKGLEVLKRGDTKKYIPSVSDDTGLRGEWVTIRDPEKERLIAALKETGVTDEMINQAINGDATPLNQHVRGVRRRINSGELATGTPNIDVYRMTIRDENDKKLVEEIISNKTTNSEIEQIVGLKPGKSVTVPAGPTNDKGSTPFKRVETAEFETEKVSGKTFKERLQKGARVLYVANSPTTNNQIVEMTDGTMYILPGGALSDIAYDNLNGWSTTNEIVEGESGLNQRLLYSYDPTEVATLLNRSNSEMASILTYTKGTGITPNDGTVTY